MYDPLMRIKSITAKDPGQNILLNYQYAYDKMDNIQSKGTEQGDYTYGYDDLYRLMSVDPATGGNEAFTYDPVGNRLTASGVTGTWTYNTNNELGGYDNVSFVYDDNGNMVQKTDTGVVTNYIYNVEDRLTEARDGSGSLIASYYYDPYGRRLWKEVSGSTTYFLYADEGLVGEYDGAGAELKTYGYAPGSTWTTDPLFMKQGANYYFYHNDHLGTPQEITAANGAVVWSAKYNAFGKAEVDPSSTINNPLRFPGQYEDDETGLHYNWHRYYDPRTGRYVISDPIGLEGGINLYPYADGNPENNTDPDGQIIQVLANPVFWVAVGVTVAVSYYYLQNPPKIPRPKSDYDIAPPSAIPLDMERGKVPDYEAEKKKYKVRNRPPEGGYGGPCKEDE